MISKAVKSSQKLKLALSGFSGAGKTFSALTIASAIGGTICVIDTENGSSALYGDKFDFNILNLTPPYSVDRYLAAIEEAKELHDIVIIDSITPEWSGEGGILEQVDSGGTGHGLKTGNTFAAWKFLTPLHNKFLQAITFSKVHMICTMLSKAAYVVQESGAHSKKQFVKIGLAPIQREGIEREFTTVFDLFGYGSACALKDRTSLFSDEIFKIDSSIGKKLVQWLNTDSPQEELLQIEGLSKTQLRSLYKEISTSARGDKLDLLSRIQLQAEALG